MGKVSEQLVALAGNCRRKNSQEFAPQRALLSDGRTDRVINHLPAAVSAPEALKGIFGRMLAKRAQPGARRPAIGRAGDVLVVVCPSTGRTIFPYDPVTTERA